jgi:hypothetical protein
MTHRAERRDPRDGPALGLTVAGDTAYVAGTSQGWNDFGADLGFLGTSSWPRSTSPIPACPPCSPPDKSRGPAGAWASAATINGSLFAFPSLGAAADKPTIQLVDASNPLNLIVSGTEVPADVTRLYGQGNFPLRHQPERADHLRGRGPRRHPATVRVDVPRNTGGGHRPPARSTFAPSQIISGAGFRHPDLGCQPRRGLGQPDIHLAIDGDGDAAGRIPFGDAGGDGRLHRLRFAGIGDAPRARRGGRADPRAGSGVSVGPPGEAAEFTLHLSNPTDAPVTYALSLQGGPGGLVGPPGVDRGPRKLDHRAASAFDVGGARRAW